MFLNFLISIIMCGNSASCFLEMIILISLVGTPSQIGVETVALYGAHEGTICLPYSIILKFYIFFFLILLLSQSTS